MVSIPSLDINMQTIKAEMNHGRWIAWCPRCAEMLLRVPAEVRHNELFVCPQEYPGLAATTIIEKPGRARHFVQVADIEERERTRQAAIRDGHAYSVEFPANRLEIEAVLSVRPAHARNWNPTVTVEELVLENAEHGL